VAVVIADSQDAATDGAEKVAVDWEPLPSVTATESGPPRALRRSMAMRPGTSRSSGPRRWAATDAAFKRRRGHGEEGIINQRLVANAMERARCVASFSPRSAS